MFVDVFSGQRKSRAFAALTLVACLASCGASSSDSSRDVPLKNDRTGGNSEVDASTTAKSTEMEQTEDRTREDSVMGDSVESSNDDEEVGAVVQEPADAPRGGAALDSEPQVDTSDDVPSIVSEDASVGDEATQSKADAGTPSPDVEGEEEAGREQADEPGSAEGGAGPGGVEEASCENVVPCGGDVVGTWLVRSSCISVAGEVDLMGFGLGCASGATNGSLQVTGSWKFNPDGTISDETTTTGEQDLELQAECLEISGTRTVCTRVAAPLSSLGFASVVCVEVEGGGCTCPATIEQNGSAALVSFSGNERGYTIANDVISISYESGEAQYSYCVSGDILTATPIGGSRAGELQGTIVFQRQ